jgi:hypothetical protein
MPILCWQSMQKFFINGKLFFFDLGQTSMSVYLWSDVGLNMGYELY